MLTVQSIFRRKRGDVQKSRVVEAHETITVNDLLFDVGFASISLPVLPDALKNEALDHLEFAAASILERVVLAALVKKYQPQRIIEIGTFRGITSLVMAMNASPGTALFTLDLPPDLTPEVVAREYYSDRTDSGFHQMAAAGASRNVGVALGLYQGDCRIQQLFGNSETMDFGPFHNTVDLFFVDGCHEYRMAKKDTYTAWNCLKSDGIIVWHDYTWVTVQKAVREAALGVPVTHVAETSIAFARKPSSTI